MSFHRVPSNARTASTLTEQTYMFRIASTGKLYEYSQGVAFPADSLGIDIQRHRSRGLLQTPNDKWFWTAVSNGARISREHELGDEWTRNARSMPRAVTATPNFLANGIIVGPDRTMLYSPSTTNNGKKAVVCGVVY